MLGTIAEYGSIALNGALDWLAWLGIQPSLQDLVKAVILTIFVLGILMIVGDVYRGEIQNQLHRIILAPSSKGAILPPEQRAPIEARRRLRKEKDIVCHVPQTLVPLTLNGIYSNVLIYFRYRDCHGKLKAKRVESYRVKFHVRKNANPSALANGHEGDHKYTAEEEDSFSEDAGVTIITMAASRVDYISFGKVQPLLEKEQKRFHAMQSNGFTKALFKSARVCNPEPLGLAVKFHFPIDPHFLLYKHPDTNVRTTAWLTVLTSVFALFMQLIYSGGGGGTSSATAATPPDRGAIVRNAGHTGN